MKPSTTNQPTPLLLSEKQAAQLFGISHRSFAELRKAEWMPRPTSFGPRLLRWSYSELVAAIERAPRVDESARAEPTRLKLGKAAAKRAAGVSA